MGEATLSKEGILISIVVPVYNMEEFLPQCLHSIDSQTSVGYEVVLVDDGSTDSSGALCDAYAEAHSNAVVAHAPNAGQLLAHRRGIAMARGDYLIFLDADDCLRCDAVEVIERAASRSHADIICFDFSRGEEPHFDSKESRVEGLAPGIYAGSKYAEVQKAVCAGLFNNLATKAVRRNIIDVEVDYAPWKGLMHGEDLLQCMAIVDRGHTLCYVDEVLYFYRENAASSTGTFKESQIGDLSAVIDRLSVFAASWGSDCVCEVRKMAGRHCYWLIVGLANAVGAFEYKRRQLCRIRHLLVRSCGEPFVLRGLRKEMILVLRLLDRGHCRLSLAAARCFDSTYRLVNRIARQRKREGRP